MKLGSCESFGANFGQRRRVARFLHRLAEGVWQKQHAKYMKYDIIISIQPEGRLWQEPEPSQATGMALAHCILGSFLGVGCHCFHLPLDVPTFASRCLHVQAT